MITHFRTSKHYWQPEMAAKECVNKFLFLIFLLRNQMERVEIFFAKQKKGVETILSGGIFFFLISDEKT